jgi:hypothetical protein
VGGKVKHGFPLLIREAMLLEVSVCRYVSISTPNNGPKDILRI